MLLHGYTPRPFTASLEFEDVPARHASSLAGKASGVDGKVAAGCYD